MEDKNKIIILAAIVAVIAIIGVLLFTGSLGSNGNKNMETTPFEMDFMTGKFTGNVKLVNDKEKFMHSYEDKQNSITYNISTVDNSTALMEIYELQGITNPDVRTFNGNDWNIYFTQAVPTNNTTNTDKPMNIIVCESQGQKQGYLIYMIIDGNSKLNATGKMYSEAYKDYVEPLLNSITLKESKNVPHVYEEFGLSQDEFNQQMDLVRQYKAGNTSVLEGVQ